MRYLKTPLIIVGSIAVLTALMVTFLEPPPPPGYEDRISRKKTTTGRSEAPATASASEIPEVGEFRRKIDQASDSQVFAAVADDIMDNVPEEHIHTLMLRLLERWVDNDLTAALDYAAKLELGSQGEALLRHALMKAGHHDFSATMEWLNGQSLNQEKEGQLLITLFGKPAENAPAEALQYVDRLDDGDFKGNVIRKLVGQWARRDPEAALEWLQSRELSEPLRRLRDSLSTTAGESEAETEGERIRAMPVGTEKNTAAREYAVKLAGEDIDAAKAWARTLEDPEAYKIALSSVYETWLRTEENKTVILEELLVESDSEFRDHLINEVALDIAATDPAQLSGLVDQLPESAKPEVTDKIVRFWKERAPHEVSAWASGLEPGPVKDRANSILVEHFIREGDKSRALSLVADIQDSELRYESVKRAAEAWYQTDPAEAGRVIESLPFLSDGEKLALYNYLEQQSE